MLLLLASLPARPGTGAPATAPVTWIQADFDELVGGELEGVALSARGELALPPRLTLLHDTTTPYVWAVAAADDGTVYFAGGSDGAVHRLSSAGETEPMASLAGNVHALRVGADGFLYASGAADGALWRLPLDGGEMPAAPWYEPEARYGWSLAVAADHLYLGTGVEGRIYRVDRSGEGTVLYDSEQTHITALALEPDGDLIVGTEEGGHIMRIVPDDTARVTVLFDSPLRQVSDLVVTDDGLFVAGIGEGASTDDANGSTADGGSDAAPRASDEIADEDLAGAVYLIHDDGYVETLWESAEESVHAMAAYGDGVLIGTSPQGRLLEIDADGALTIQQSVEAAQITALEPQVDDTLLVGTANVGKLYRLGRGHGDSGSYLSRVKDTGTTSRWGRLRWSAETPAGTSVRLYTRSGNTDEPDGTWSDWSAPYDDPEGSPIVSAPARFIQWRAELTTDDPAVGPSLDRVELVYVQRNLRPRIDEFRVHPGGVVYRQTTSFEDSLPFGQVPPSVQAELDRQSGRQGGSGASSGSFLGRPFYVPGSRTFSWEASDPNGDRMAYELAYRAEGESAWKTIATGLTEAVHVWDTTAVPDGRYRARVTADDSPANPAGHELEGERVSSSFVIDNTPPSVTRLQADTRGDRVTVRGRVDDEVSLIYALEYAVDGGPWHAVAPADGLADASGETIDLTTDPLAAGEHTIIVRATDAALNRGSARVVVTVR